MSDLIETPGTGLTRVTKRPKAQQGLALINATLTDLARPMQIADRCAQRMKQFERGDLYRLNERELNAVAVACAQQVHPRFVPDFAAARDAGNALFGIATFNSPAWECRSPLTLTHAVASAMLGVLFATLTKKRADDANGAVKLEVIADMFNPLNDALASATGAEPVSKYPAVLALAIKQLLATEVFEPTQVEIGAAMKRAHAQFRWHYNDCEKFVALAKRADEVLFECDRAAWDAAYAKVGSEVVAAMREELHESDVDEDGNDIPTSPRWAALNALCQARMAAEKPALAACEAKPVKRTQKPKETGKRTKKPETGNPDERGD
jgi:hypothetical protein